ncbi:type VII secretion protein EccB [Streptomyces monticola]|uniref:Type VII secretion protein EccB n=1 Tax=Streptomyces monticola TaxID=2666263 RepID=A0ABW2JTG7_9ACTN
MAKRRDELAAYTFARKRTVAAFLAPEPGGSEEGAPRPVRTVMPSLAIGVVLVIGFIAWGVIKPAAPKGWDTPGEHIIVDSDSTTRYIVLKEGGDKVLHPVLNYASAKLLLDKGKGTVIEVPAKEIDKSGIRHGSTIGIPYAPDRMPAKDDAETPKTWAVCERPAKGGKTLDRAVFVLNKEDAEAVNDEGKVSSKEALYVYEPESKLRFLVDGKGNVFRLGNNEVNADPVQTRNLLNAVVGGSAEPQPVSAQWLKTLRDRGPITFPDVPGAGGTTGVQGLPEEATTIGKVLKAEDAQGEGYFVVLKDEVAAISPFVAGLLRNSPTAKLAYGTESAEPIEVDATDITAANGGEVPEFFNDKGWPQRPPKQANAVDEATGTVNNTSCSVFDGKASRSGLGLAAWAGKAYPKKVIADSLNAYVSSGSGLIFQEVRSATGGGGGWYLLTDTGLRYSLPSGNDSAADKDGSKATGSKDGQPSETDKARTRLGYEKVKRPAIVPRNWAEFIPKGPMLDTGSAAQEQSQ